MKRGKHSYLIILIPLTFLAIGTLDVLFLLATLDIAPPDTSDLVPERPVTQPEENAYTHFLAATNFLYWPTNSDVVTEYLDGKPVDDTVIQDIIVRNTEARALIEKGLRCRICLTPELMGFDTLLPYLAPWRQIGRIMASEVRYNRLAGKHTEATRTCITLLRFGNAIQRDSGSLIDCLVSCLIIDLGLAQAHDLACDSEMPKDASGVLSEALADLGPFGDGLARAMKAEYRCQAITTDKLRDGTLDIGGLPFGPWQNVKAVMKHLPNYVFQPNKTKRLYADQCRNIITNASQPYASLAVSNIEDHIIGSSKHKVLRAIRPNLVGRILCTLTAPACIKIVELKCRTEANLAAVRLILACNAYERANGRLPDSLQALVPRYLPAIPRDPFDGKEFKYSPAKGTVYSVGKDLKDSGGATNAPVANWTSSPAGRWKADDAVYEIRAKAE